MNVTNNANSLPMKIVEELTKNLDITDSMFEDAKAKYLAVAKYLGESDNALLQDAIIYPQGSINLRTVVKPIGKDEFDIDLVINLPHITDDNDPEHILKVIGDRLKEQTSIYKDKIEKLRRGWRINYASHFHLDITPAINDAFADAEVFKYSDTAELVPDNDLKTWKASNPRGFEKWFSEIADKMPNFVFNRSVSDSFMEANLSVEAYTIEDIPDNNEYKELLRRTVQLLKRHRDQYFCKRHIAHADFKPISIVITTLAAKSYDMIVEKKQAYSCPFELLKDIVKNMHNFIKIGDEYKIANPTNESENFAEKWNKDSRYVKAFADWQQAAYNELVELQQQNGLDKIGLSLENAYGKDSAEDVIRRLTEKVNDDRMNNMLSVGIITSMSTTNKVKTNTFYGH